MADVSLQHGVQDGGSSGGHGGHRGPAPGPDPPGDAVGEPLGDPRAAGVISSEDPYRDFELYLEKVAVSTSMHTAWAHPQHPVLQWQRVRVPHHRPVMSHRVALGRE